MKKNAFDIMLSVPELKKILVNGFKNIYSSIYEDIPERWISKEMTNKYGYKFSIWGPGDLDETTNAYKWSKSNLFNTNYTVLETLRNLLYYDGVTLIFNDDPSKDIIGTAKVLDIFFIELEKRKIEYFMDGEIKDQLMLIIDGTWGIGSNHSTTLKNNYKTYFPEAISIDNKGDEIGDTEDMLLGIDNTIFFNDNIKKTTQNKGCKKVVLVNDEYHVYCTVDYSKYNDNIVNYFVFFPSNDIKKVYIFKNDHRLVRNEVINNKPVFIINSSLLHYDGER